MSAWLHGCMAAWLRGPFSVPWGDVGGGGVVAEAAAGRWGAAAGRRHLITQARELREGVEDLHAEMEYLESSVTGCRRKVAKAEQTRAAHAMSRLSDAEVGGGGCWAVAAAALSRRGLVCRWARARGVGWVQPAAA
jgi:hypothetical protein